MPTWNPADTISDDLEDPASAQEDYDQFQSQIVKPVVQLLARLGTPKAQMRSAQQLNWSQAKVTDSDCTLIAQILKESTNYTGNSRVALIGLDNNMISDVGMVQIAESLSIPNSMLANVTCFWLNNNQIGDAGTEALASALQQGAMVRLQKLYLHDNKIGDDGKSTARNIHVGRSCPCPAGPSSPGCHRMHTRLTPFGLPVPTEPYASHHRDLET